MDSYFNGRTICHVSLFVTDSALVVLFVVAHLLTSWLYKCTRSSPARPTGTSSKIAFGQKYFKLDSAASFYLTPCSSLATHCKLITSSSCVVRHPPSRPWTIACPISDLTLRLMITSQTGPIKTLITSNHRLHQQCKFGVPLLMNLQYLGKKIELFK